MKTMPVRKTEQHLPAGYSAEDFGQSSQSADGKIALISFNSSPVVQQRLQSYVVFVLDSSLAAQVDHFDWVMQTDVGENISSDTGFISFRPASGEILTVSVKLKGGADEDLGQVQLEQSIVESNSELKDLYEQTDEAAPLAGQPETSREVINDLRLFIDELAPRDADAESSLNRLLFSVTYVEVMGLPVEKRNVKLEKIADALHNDDASLFVEEGDAGIGVCRLRPHVLGMYIPETPGDTNWYLPKKEYPAEESERLELHQKLKKELQELAPEKQINFFNLLRFPKSNLKMARQFLMGVKEDYFSGETTLSLINDEQQVKSLLDQFKRGPYHSS